MYDCTLHVQIHNERYTEHIQVCLGIRFEMKASLHQTARATAKESIQGKYSNHSQIPPAPHHLPNCT